MRQVVVCKHSSGMSRTHITAVLTGGRRQAEACSRHSACLTPPACCLPLSPHPAQPASSPPT